MSDEIKVGDRVKRSSGTCVYTVLALDDKGLAWIQTENSTLGMIVHLSTLTRIEPEPVTLTPKYAVGQRVRSTLTGTIYTIEALVRTTYRTTTGCTVDESNLEPVPTPCPTCKGTGVSEGSA